MKEITLKELIELDYCINGISNFKLIEGECSRCGNSFEYSNVKKFMRNRKNNPNKEEWVTCRKCYLRIKTGESQEWIEKNSKAQLIAQNKPETKEKNRIGVSKSWDEERKKKHREVMFKKWKSGDYANANNGGHRGVYNEIQYQSWSELSYILFCESENITLRRFDLEPIQYIYKSRKKVYIPDFIINNNHVIEIKGKAPWFYKNYDQNIAKIEAAKNIYKKYSVIFDTDDCIKKFYNKARSVGYEIEKKNI